MSLKADSPNAETEPIIRNEEMDHVSLVLSHQSLNEKMPVPFLCSLASHDTEATTDKGRLTGLGLEVAKLVQVAVVAATVEQKHEGPMEAQSQEDNEVAVVSQQLS